MKRESVKREASIVNEWLIDDSRLTLYDHKKLNMQKITVRAPATVANLVCGFDILGLCLHEPYDLVEVAASPEPGVHMRAGSGFPVPLEPGRNTAGAPLIEMLKELPGGTGFEVTVHKRIRPGSGAGSSAASAAGAVVAANMLLGNRFEKNDLLRFALFGEKVASGVKHADNLAPLIWGGVTLIRSIHPLDVVPLSAPPLWITLAHPQIEVQTADARRMLRQEIQLRDAIRQWGNIAGLVAGLSSGDYSLIGRSLEDVVIEPVRSILIPHFAEAKSAALRAGALGGGISGSGPSLFMLSRTEAAARAAEKAIAEVYREAPFPLHTYVTTLNREGITEQKNPTT